MQRPLLNWVGLLLFQLMMWLVQIICLNMLIAIMTDSYDKVREAAHSCCGPLMTLPIPAHHPLLRAHTRATRALVAGAR